MHTLSKFLEELLAWTPKVMTPIILQLCLLFEKSKIARVKKLVNAMPAHMDAWY